MNSIIDEQADLIRNYVLDFGFTGSVLAAIDDKVILHEGFGWIDRLGTNPVLPDTPFWVASITKQFTAAAVLKLAEEGKLSVEDPIDKHFENIPEDKRGITIHRLLTHTAGLRQNYAADGIIDRGEAARLILEKPLKAAPGQGFGYSNDAYNLLAILIEIVSGETYEAYLRRSLFEPAGFLHTGFWEHPGHESVAEIHGEVAPEVRQANWGFRGAVGIYSTTGDLYRWNQVLQGNSVLTRESCRKLVAAHISLGETERHGYGWFLTRTPRGSTAVWTRGTEGFGHNAILMTFPEEKVVLAAVSNAGDRDGLAISRRLVEGLVEFIFSAPGEL